MMDREFEKIKVLLLMVQCNTTATKEHVSKVEQMIQTINSLSAMDGHDRPLKY
jgi:hypothetical protein